jgi:hypothetical protein
MLDFAKDLQPFRTQADFDAMTVSLSAASSVMPENNGTACVLTVPRAVAISSSAPPRNNFNSAFSFFVSPTGNDAATGTISSPFATLARGVAAARTAAPPGAPRAVTLLTGTYYMNGSTLTLDARDSGLTLSSTENATVSGGTLLQGLSWVRGIPTGAWCAPLGMMSPSLPQVLGLRDARSGSRYTRARFPNVDVDTESILDSGVVPASNKWTLGPHFEPARVLYPAYPLREDIQLFRHYTLGFAAPGSACSHLSPPYAFWCSNLTDREHNGTGFLSYPSAVSVNTSLLPHLPYANATGGVLHSWHAGRWFSVQFALDAKLTTWDAATGVSNFTFAAGGWQGSRGYGSGIDISVENVREELDAPGEFFFDEVSRELCVIPLAGGMPPDASLVALGPGSKVLVNVSGSQAVPVVNLSFIGLGFSDAAHTYLDPHGLPSGGDWALARTAAVFLEGIEGLRVEGCTFTALDNNALFLSGYSRGAVITSSTFSLLGESAIALWGRVGGAEADGAPDMGWDTRNGDQPRFTSITNNLCSRIGIWQKQSACVFQAEAALTTISHNIFYDVPRAAINENELGMGGSIVERNAIWSVCRETADNGVWNSWSRTARVNDLHADGSPGSVPTTVPLWTHARDNMWIAQLFPKTKSGFAPGASQPFDTDDGSSYLNVTGNVWVYGSNSLKSDFYGHDNRQIGNLVLFFGSAFGVAAVLPGHADVFENNTVVFMADGVIGYGQDCSANATRTLVRGNRYVSPTGALKECGKTLTAWQALDPANNDPGSVAEAYPADLATAAVAWARALLGL